MAAEKVDVNTGVDGVTHRGWDQLFIIAKVMRMFSLDDERPVHVNASGWQEHARACVCVCVCYILTPTHTFHR